MGEERPNGEYRAVEPMTDRVHIPTLPSRVYSELKTPHPSLRPVPTAIIVVICDSKLGSKSHDRPSTFAYNRMRQRWWMGVESHGDQNGETIV